MNAFCCFGPHSILAEPLSIVKNGRFHSAIFTINQLKVVIRPINF
jgi:hypothetical protein